MAELKNCDFYELLMHGREEDESNSPLMRYVIGEQERMLTKMVKKFREAEALIISEDMRKGTGSRMDMHYKTAMDLVYMSEATYYS